MANCELIRELQTLVNAQSDKLITTAREIFANPEVAFTEHLAATVLALCAVEVLDGPELRKAIRADFERQV